MVMHVKIKVICTNLCSVVNPDPENEHLVGEWIDTLEEKYGIDYCDTCESSLREGKYMYRIETEITNGTDIT